MLGFLLCLRSFTYGLIHMSLGLLSCWVCTEDLGQGLRTGVTPGESGRRQVEMHQAGGTSEIATWAFPTPNLNQEAPSFQMTSNYPLLSMIRLFSPQRQGR